MMENMQAHLKPIPTHRITCEFTGRFYLEISESGIGAWCVNCRQQHVLPREQAVQILTSEPTQSIKCPYIRRSHLKLGEFGTSAWCVHCRRPHVEPREKIMALLSGAGSDSVQKQEEQKSID